MHTIRNPKSFLAAVEPYIGRLRRCRLTAVAEIGDQLKTLRDELYRALDQWDEAGSYRAAYTIADLIARASVILSGVDRDELAGAFDFVCPVEHRPGGSFLFFTSPLTSPAPVYPQALRAIPADSGAADLMSAAA